MRFRILLAALALTLPAIAQSGFITAGTSSSSSGIRGTMHLSPHPYLGPVVTGAPYSAERVTERVQTAVDGTRFTSTDRRETLYRDSQGRTRTERPMMMGPNAPDAPMLVEISDPVANVGYTLDTQNKIAHRYAYAAAPSRQAPTALVRSGSFAGTVAPPAAPAPARTRPEMSREDLGSQRIEGVMATGQRFVQTWPTGSQGNDRPFQTVSETWMSPELNLPVLSRNIDPRSGENSMKLLNISRLEPSAALFAPPPDYTVVDETGSFEIQWTGARQ